MSYLIQANIYIKYMSVDNYINNLRDAKNSLLSLKNYLIIQQSTTIDSIIARYYTLMHSLPDTIKNHTNPHPNDVFLLTSLQYQELIRFTVRNSVSMQPCRIISYQSATLNTDDKKQSMWPIGSPIGFKMRKEDDEVYEIVRLSLIHI